MMFERIMTSLIPCLECPYRFIFKEQYIQLSTSIPKKASLYGLGETTLSTGLLLPRNGYTMTLWNRDKASAYPDINLYSSHPFYLQVNPGGRRGLDDKHIELENREVEGVRGDFT